MFSFLSPTCRYLGIIWGLRLDLRYCLKFEFDGQCSYFKVKSIPTTHGRREKGHISGT